MAKSTRPERPTAPLSPPPTAPRRRPRWGLLAGICALLVGPWLFGRCAALLPRLEGVVAFCVHSVRDHSATVALGAILVVLLLVLRLGGSPPQRR